MLRNVTNYISFKNTVTLNIIPLIAKEYMNVETFKMYYDNNNNLVFNPKNSKLLDFLNKPNVKNDIITVQLNKGYELKLLDTKINILSKYLSQVNIKTNCIKGVHTAFSLTCFDKDFSAISTLTKNKNIIKIYDVANHKKIFNIDNKITGIDSKILHPVLIDNKKIELVNYKTQSLTSTRFLLNESKYANFYCASQLTQENTYYGFDFNDVIEYKFFNTKGNFFQNVNTQFDYKKNLMSFFKDYNSFYDSELRNLNTYNKNIFLMSYINEYNPEFFTNLYIREKILNTDYEYIYIHE